MNGEVYYSILLNQFLYKKKADYWDSIYKMEKKFKLNFHIWEVNKKILSIISSFSGLLFKSSSENSRCAFYIGLRWKSCPWLNDNKNNRATHRKPVPHLLLCCVPGSARVSRGSFNRDNCQTLFTLLAVRSWLINLCELISRSARQAQRRRESRPAVAKQAWVRNRV